MNNINKPIDLAVVDTKESILQTLNSASLPISVLSLIVADINHIVKAQEKLTIDQLRAQSVEVNSQPEEEIHEA